MTANPQSHLGGFIEGGDPDTWYPDLWTWACHALGVRSVLDVGCGEGHTARYFKDLGCVVLGIDGSSQAMKNSVIPEFQLIHDFTSGPFEPGRTFNLVWSCEFVEHVAEPYAKNFLHAFKSSDKYIIMTHAVPGQKGYHHVNCQPSSYWVKKMHDLGFDLDYSLTRQARVKARRGYFKKSGLVFAKSTARRFVPAGLFLALLSVEWSTRRAFSYARNHGVAATLRRLVQR